jgi:hypothetical protein
VSYARFGVEGSDVYVYLGSSGLECCACALSPRSQTFKTTEAMIEHLREHVKAGHVVPADTITELLADHDANDLFIATGDERYLDGICGEAGPDGAVCRWPKGHPAYLYDPGVTREGRACEVAHSWAEPPLWPAAVRVGKITEVP